MIDEEPQQEKSELENFPSEILEHIIYYLPQRDCIALAYATHNSRPIIDNYYELARKIQISDKTLSSTHNFNNLLKYLKNHYVTEINLSYTNIIDESLNLILQEVGQNLRILNLHECLNLQNPNFSYCQNLQKLECINCSNLQNINLSSCVNLQKVFCIGCDALLNIDMINCPRLQELTLSECPNVQIANCPSVEILDLSGAFITSQKLEQGILQLPGIGQALKELYLKNCNQLQSINLSNYDNLQRISCRGCKSLQNINMMNCFRLEWLDFTSCKDLQTINLNNCTSLQELNLSYTNITDEQLKLILQQVGQNLKELNLSGCPMRYILDKLAYCTRLERLDLTNCIELQDQEEQISVMAKKGIMIIQKRRRY